MDFMIFDIEPITELEEDKVYTVRFIPGKKYKSRWENDEAWFYRVHDGNISIWKKN